MFPCLNWCIGVDTSHCYRSFSIFSHLNITALHYNQHMVYATIYNVCACAHHIHPEHQVTWTTSSTVGFYFVLRQGIRASDYSRAYTPSIVNANHDTFTYYHRVYIVDGTYL